MNTVFNLAGLALHQMFYHDSHNWSAYQILGCIIVAAAVATVVIAADDKDMTLFVAGRIITGAIALAAVWPFLVVAAAPVLAVGIVYWGVRSWLDLIPSKDQRAEKAAQKVAAIRGKIEEAA